ncbi:hypothetical protein AK812_SmicGene48131 [Symbiodinium microadriaticum]|uniref:Uncharacterized protein n=1 Tax=Symbiodinium microadriaticum TaxID=2951 RepID=A0A1Q9BQJ0_SYMMI|nr:hypothetical protein AK812_SmicGene48131 [Symbiodinium microadriaticum]CAE7948834.1 unnamed protein product [Symbiodinium sp. KB8]
MDISRGYIDAMGRPRRSGVYPGTFALKVADSLLEHFKTMKPKPVVNEEDMQLFDGSEDDSDSGLENLVGK